MADANPTPARNPAPVITSCERAAKWFPACPMPELIAAVRAELLRRQADAPAAFHPQYEITAMALTLGFQRAQDIPANPKPAPPAPSAAPAKPAQVPDATPPAPAPPAAGTETAPAEPARPAGPVE